MLCYHRVLPAGAVARAPFPGLVVPAAVFEAQMQFVARHFEVATLSAAAARRPAANRGDRPLAVVTFDDGYADNHRVAWPVLERLGLAATVFLATDLIGASAPLWFDAFALAVLAAKQQGRIETLAAALLKREAWQPAARALVRPGAIRARVHAAVSAMKAMAEAERAALVRAAREHVGGLEPGAARAVRLMTWEEVGEMAAAGVEFGSHTATHPILVGLDDARLDREIRGSKAALESRLGRPVAAFSYPNGDHDDRVVRAVEAAGYACAVTTRAASIQPGTSPYHLPRHHVGPRTGVGLGGRFSPAVFAAELLQLF